MTNRNDGHNLGGVLLNNCMGLPPLVLPMVSHPVTGQPLGVSAVIMMIPDEIMTAIGEMVRKVMQEVVREELAARFNTEIARQILDIPPGDKFMVEDIEPYGNEPGA